MGRGETNCVECKDRFYQEDDEDLCDSCQRTENLHEEISTLKKANEALRSMLIAETDGRLDVDAELKKLLEDSK